MPALNYSVSLAADTPEDINDVITRFNEIRAVVNALDNDNIAGGAGIEYSKLALANKLVNADLAATAGVKLSKLEALASGRVVVGSGANVPTAVPMTGDVGIDSAGVTTLQPDSVNGSQVVAGSLTPDEFASSVVQDNVATNTAIGASFTSWGSAVVNAPTTGRYLVIANAAFIGLGTAHSLLMGIRVNGAASSYQQSLFVQGAVVSGLAVTVSHVPLVTAGQTIDLATSSTVAAASNIQAGSHITAVKIGKT